MKIKILIMLLVALMVTTCIVSVYTYVNYFTTEEVNAKIYKKVDSNNDDNIPEHSIPASVSVKEDIYAYSSKDCFKKTLYTASNNINLYDQPDGDSKIIKSLSSNEPLVVYKDLGEFLYCEESTGIAGYVKKSSSFKKTMDYTNNYLINVNLTNQNIKIYKDAELIKDIVCSTGTIGNQNTETPLGKFKVIVRGEEFYNSLLNEGAKYYLQFFGDYLIHSIPVDENGNIIEKEEDKLGSPASHGCIRVSVENAKWLYDNVPDGAEVFIHY